MLAEVALFFCGTLNQEQEISRAAAVPWWQHPQTGRSFFQPFSALLGNTKGRLLSRYHPWFPASANGYLCPYSQARKIKCSFGFMGEKWKGC